MTNSVSATVISERGEPLFDDERRGICGAAIRDASVSQVKLFSKLLGENHRFIQLIGGGGAENVEHVWNYLDAGASAVHMATAPMVNPLTALQIKRHLAAAE
jgi:dihydroorotate dehydrogenase (NAD+) catalytic subunit